MTEKTTSPVRASHGENPFPFSIGRPGTCHPERNRLFLHLLYSPKLSVNAPGDKYEKEADAVADKVMRMPAPQVQRLPEREEEEELKMKQRPDIQRKCKECEEEEMLLRKPLASGITSLVQQKTNGDGAAVDNRVASTVRTTNGRGQPLPQDTRTWMESRIGADFSDVNIHTGSNTVQLSRELNAQAFTHGSNIYFNKGKYRPETGEGKRLLAHELTHVVQQNSGKLQKKTVQRDDEDPCSYGPHNRTEREVHLNLRLRSVRVYTRSGRSFNHVQFDNIVAGPATSELARSKGWCTMYLILARNIGPTPTKQLYNFVSFWNEGAGYGFHSDHWGPEGELTKILGTESAGCVSMRDPGGDIESGDSRRLYNEIRNGDCVRMYVRSFWRDPTFARCSSVEGCS